MTPRLPARTAKDIIKVLKEHGFTEARQSGSHVILKNASGGRVTVPVHASRDLGKGLLKQIMKDAKLEIVDL